MCFELDFNLLKQNIMEEIFKIHQFDMTWYNSRSNESNGTTKWNIILVYNNSDQICFQTCGHLTN